MGPHDDSVLVVKVQSVVTCFWNMSEVEYQMHGNLENCHYHTPN